MIVVKYLKQLYDEKPLLLILLLAILATIPWLGMGEFYTKGEPREASLAISMIKDGNWIIPYGYVDEFAYKPPLNHWLIALFSLISGGEVSEYTSRLPSALAFIMMMGVSFSFFQKRVGKLESFVAAMLVMTCFEIHRAAVTTRVDMMLTAFMVVGMIQMVRWYENKKTTTLMLAWLCITCSVLVKGPVGIVLPNLVFGVYLLFKKEPVFTIIKKCLMISLPAFIVPAIWYYLAYQIKGDEFLRLVFAENFGRFLGISTEELGIHYNLGVENPFWYYPPMLLAGLLPWSLLLLISLFFINYSKPKHSFSVYWNRLKNMDNTLLFSLLSVVLILAFYTIPTSKRTVYIMPLYPFLAIFMAQYFIYIAHNIPKALKAFAYFMSGLVSLILVLILGSAFKLFSLYQIGSSFTKRDRTLYDISVISDTLSSPSVLGIIITLILLSTLVYTIYTFRKKMYLPLLISCLALMYSINLMLDGFILPNFKTAHSSKYFAERIMKNHHFDHDIYVTNNLFEFGNIYGLNFYMGNNFRNFAKEKPETGYFIIGITDFETFRAKYATNYEFVIVDEMDNSYSDFKNKAILYKFKKLD